MHGTVAGGDLLADVVDHRLGIGRQQLFKADQSRGSEAELEQVRDRAGHFAETDADVIVQIHGDTRRCGPIMLPRISPSPAFCTHRRHDRQRALG